MKGLFRLILVCAALFALVISGCKGGGITPKASFEGWMAAMKECNTAVIKAGLSKESIQQIDDMLKQLAALMPPDKAKDFDVYQQMCKGFKPAEVVNEEVTGETATLTIKSENKEEKIPMKKEDGAWKVDFASLIKKAPAGEAPPPPPPPTAAPAAAPAAAPVAPPPAPPAPPAAK